MKQKNMSYIDAIIALEQLEHMATYPEIRYTWERADKASRLSNVIRTALEESEEELK